MIVVVASGTSALFAVPAGAGSPATVVDSETLVVFLDTPGSGTLDAFDPALGTLTSVELAIRTEVLLQTCIENLSAESGSTVVGDISGHLAAEFPSGQNTTRADVAAVVQPTPLPSTNGSSDCPPGFSDSAGRYQSPVSASDVGFFQRGDTANTSRTLTSAADMAPFVGPGVVGFSYESASLGEVVEPTEWDIVFVAQGTLTVTVTYTYEPGGAPTPTTTGPTTTLPGPLPVTGSSSTGVTPVAAVALVLGVALVAVSRIRRPVD